MDENQQNPQPNQGGDSLADRLNQVNPGGGAMNQPPQPQQPTETPASMAQSQNQPPTGVNDQSMSGPAMSPETATPAATNGQEPAAFRPAGLDDSGPMFSPNESGAGASGSGMLEPEIQTGGSRSMWWLAGIIIGIVILALVGYFVVYPMLSGSSQDGPTTPVVDDGQGSDVGTDTAPVTNQETMHNSLFAIDPASTVELEVGSQFDSAILTALLLREGGRSEPMTLTEVVLKKDKTSVLPFPDFLSTIAPSSNEKALLSSLFEDDFTAFVYRDGAGLIWPGYVATIKSGADPNRLNSWLNSLESGQLREYFLVNPGTFGEFKNGEVFGVPDRYAVGSTTGASFGYLASGDKILISTSFEGMKEAMRLLAIDANEK